MSHGIRRGVAEFVIQIRILFTKTILGTLCVERSKLWNLVLISGADT